MRSLAVVVVLLLVALAGCTSDSEPSGPSSGSTQASSTGATPGGPSPSASPPGAPSTSSAATTQGTSAPSVPWTVSIAGPGNGTVAHEAELVVAATAGTETGTVQNRIMAGPDQVDAWPGTGSHTFTPDLPGAYTLETTAVSASGAILAQANDTLAVTYQGELSVSCRAAVNGGVAGDACPGFSVQLGNMSVHFRATVTPPQTQTQVCGAVVLYHDGVEYERTSVVMQESIEVNYVVDSSGNWTIDWEPAATVIVLTTDYAINVRPYDGTEIAANVETC